MLKEINLIRSVACLAVVMIHSISYTYNLIPIKQTEIEFLKTIQMLLMFGTPIFIFLSEFLVSYNYIQGIPKGFIIKRIKFILIPYIFMGVFYRIVEVLQSGDITLISIIKGSVANVALGSFHGYFVLIIFQFYFLHLIIDKYKNVLDNKKIVISTLFFSVVYLCFFNFTQPIDMPYGEFVWSKLYFLFFPAWLIYFVLGYYGGLYFDKFKNILIKYKKIFFASLLVSSIFLLFASSQDFFTQDSSSKRIDVVLYASSFILCIFYASMKLNKIPRFAFFISSYSFSIYLLHMFFLIVSSYLLIRLPMLPYWVYAMLYFILSLTGSIIVTFLLNKFKLGKYIVGRINLKKESRSFSTANSKEKTV